MKQSPAHPHRNHDTRWHAGNFTGGQRGWRAIVKLFAFSGQHPACCLQNKIINGLTRPGAALSKRRVEHKDEPGRLLLQLIRVERKGL